MAPLHSRNALPMLALCCALCAMLLKLSSLSRMFGRSRDINDTRIRLSDWRVATT